MSGGSVLPALTPALLAGVFGGAAYAIWGMPEAIVAAAVLGAATGSLAAGSVEPVEPAAPAAPTAPPPSAPLKDRKMLDALPVAVVIVGPDRSIAAANELAHSYFGISNATGLPVATLRARRLLEGIEAAMTDGAVESLEFSVTRSGVEAYLKAHIARMPDTGEVVVAIWDETQARRARESHRDFVANASHELKTPLAAVSGIIETLLGHARSDPQATERFLRLLGSQAHRMTRLIEDLMSLNRVELNERVIPDEPHDLVGILSEVVDALRLVAEVAEVELDFQAPSAGAVVMADRDELGQLFQNLIDNAIKYGGQGTKVTVGQRGDTPPIPGMAGVYVRDEGPGIPREDIPRLTERFYRVNVKRSRDKGGTGLGLAICKHIANRHRGRLEIESQVGTGSRFTVWLPTQGDLAENPGTDDSDAQSSRETQAAAE